MNRNVFLALLLVSLSATNLIFSQEKILPGAVQNPYYWIKTQKNAGGYYWENMTLKQGQIPLNKQSGADFNFNPSIVFDAVKDSLILPLGKEIKKCQTFFMVYKVKDSLKEQFLWTINDYQKTLTVATNKRLVDLKRYLQL